MSKRAEKEAESKQLIHQLVEKVEQEPDNQQAYYELGSYLTKLKDYPQAEELYKKALSHFDGQSDLLQYGLGNVFYEAELYPEAIQSFQKITNQAMKENAFLMLAQSYMAQEQYQQALAFAITAQEITPKNPDTNELIGDIFLALGQFENAARYYDLVLEVDAHQAKANFQRGLANMVLGLEFEPYFELAKASDQAYFAAQKQRLSEIEAFIKLRDK
ncbi:tetratricopeptide repeat protein [Dellaglioa sp. L3N]